MSMISYAAGSRYLSLLGGVLLSFYDCYCDQPPSSPQTWGEQTDVPEIADCYNSGFLLVWGSNVPMTRAPDAQTVAPHDVVATNNDEVLVRNLPVRTVALADGSEAKVATVFDLFCASYGLDRGIGGENVARSFDDDVPFTPAWTERVTGVPRQAIVEVAREFAQNAETTQGRSMLILGAGLNDWYHMDMSDRGIIALLVMCGCVGKSGGGWAHYGRRSSVRRPAGCHSPSPSTGSARHGR